MVDLAVDLLSWMCLLGGSAFALIGALGILRLPDLFCRMHAGGLIETGGVGLIFLGLMLQGGFTLVTVKLLLIVVFLMFTNPTTTHALARAALIGGLTPLLDPDSAPYTDPEAPSPAGDPAARDKEDA